MQDLKTKFFKIYIPYLIVAFGTILFYYGFRWLFDIKLNILELNEEILNFWIPILLVWIPVAIWLHKRVYLLKLRGSNADGHSFVLFLIYIVITLSLVLSQKYLERSAYDLNEIEASTDFEKFQDEKYFKIEHFNVTQTFHHHYVSRRTSGKYNNNLDVTLYIVCPFKDSEFAWYGVKYTITLSNKSSKQVKQREIRRFLQTSKKDFETYNFKDAIYFEKLGYSDDKDGFIEAIKRNLPNIIEDQEVILVPKKKPFDQRFESIVFAMCMIFSIGSFIILLFVLIPKIDKQKLANFNKK